MGISLVPLAAITPISARVVRILGMNPGRFTLQGTNTYLVGTGATRVLIDTGAGHAAYVPLLRQAMQDHGIAAVSAIVCTHWHYDHVRGVPAVLEALAATAPPQTPPPTLWKYPRSPALDAHLPCAFAPLRDGQRLTTEGASLRVIHLPGHTSDHVCLQLEETGDVFSGDLVLGQGTAAFEDLTQTVASLTYLRDTLLPPKQGVRRLFPGHGPVVEDGHAAADMYLRHRARREAALVQLLPSASPAAAAAAAAGADPVEVDASDAADAADPWVDALVRQLYPADLAPPLWKAARHNVRQHLRKLVHDRRVAFSPRDGYAVLPAAHL